MWIGNIQVFVSTMEIRLQGVDSPCQVHKGRNSTVSHNNLLIISLISIWCTQTAVTDSNRLTFVCLYRS